MTADFATFSPVSYSISFYLRQCTAVIVVLHQKTTKCTALLTSISPDDDFLNAAATVVSSLLKALSRLNRNITSSGTPFMADLSRTETLSEFLQISGPLNSATVHSSVFRLLSLSRNGEPTWVLVFLRIFVMLKIYGKHYASVLILTDTHIQLLTINSLSSTDTCLNYDSKYKDL